MKKGFKFGCLGIIVLIVLIIVIGMFTGDDEETTNDNNTTTETNEAGNQTAEEQPEEAEEPIKDVYAVGEAIQLGDNVLTVTEVERSSGSEYDKPQQGKEYVIVTVEISNAGDENISYNPFDFKMSNSQGQIVDQAFTTIDTDTSLQSGELAPGGKVSGTIAFEQPAGDPELQLQYTPGFWSDETVKVNLQ